MLMRSLPSFRKYTSEMQKMMCRIVRYMRSGHVAMPSDDMHLVVFLSVNKLATGIIPVPFKSNRLSSAVRP